MEQKITWMLYSFIGISIVLFASGCGKEDIEYRMTVDLEYTNQTDSTVSFEIYESISSNIFSTVTLQPSSNSKIFSYDYEGVNENITPETCCNSFLENVYSRREINGSSKTIKLNDSLCVTHLNDKSTEITNYEVQIISERHYRYTYNFGKNDLLDAKICK